MQKPILFSTPMVRAILDDRKNVTRRVVKPQPPTSLSKVIDSGIWTFTCSNPGEEWKCPYGQPGDLLWVRETFAIIDDREFGGKRYPQYKVDRPNDAYPGDWPEEEARGNPDAPKWKPSIFMPKKYARIWLEITGVRVERLQDITYAEVIAEGLTWLLTDEQQTDGEHRRGGIRAFKRLWDSINGKKHPWESNPYCWVIEFRRIEK